MNTPFLIPSDINNNKTIIPPFENIKKLSIGIYTGNGAAEEGIQDVKNNIHDVLNIETHELSAETIQSTDLSDFDVLIFSGGSGSKQAESLGAKGREHIRNYVQNGGKYLGICAGAYLATARFEWALHIVNAETISTTEWKRGKGFVDIELTDEGREIFGDVTKSFKCRYSSGPILKAAHSTELPPFVTLANFRSEVSEHGVTEGVMIDTPAIVTAQYRKGTVVLISTHPENTPGLENVIPCVIHWMTT